MKIPYQTIKLLYKNKRSFLTLSGRRNLLINGAFSELEKDSDVLNFFTSSKKYLDDYIYDKLLNLIYNPKSDIGRNLFLKGKFEADEIAYSTKLIQSYDPGTILDIGANIGLHVISWAKAVGKHKYYAFEPTRKVNSILKANIKSNNLEGGIITIEKAVSNKVGTASFYETIDDAYNSLKDTKRKNIDKIYEVKLETIDSFIENNKILDLRFIKIDTEGFEDEVIQGAIRTIEIYKPDFFIEIYGGTDSNKNPEKTIQRMIDFGYNVYVYNDKLLKPYENHEDKFYNYFFSKNVLQ
jgi:FkbM family methyltransferase